MTDETRAGDGSTDSPSVPADSGSVPADSGSVPGSVPVPAGSGSVPAAPASGSVPAGSGSVPGSPSVPASVPAGSADEHRDELPDELDARGYVGPYTFPNNNRRRISGLIMTGVGLICVATFLLRGGGVLVNRGLFYGGLFLLALACYHFASGVTLRVNETDALVAATKTVGFTVGHASAQLSWRGLISHPTWRILLYSADDPPKKRALVLVDGVLGTVGDHFVENNPEGWSSLDR